MNHHWLMQLLAILSVIIILMNHLELQFTIKECMLMMFTCVQERKESLEDLATGLKQIKTVLMIIIILILIAVDGILNMRLRWRFGLKQHLYLHRVPIIFGIWKGLPLGCGLIVMDSYIIILEYKAIMVKIGQQLYLLTPYQLILGTI